MDACISSAKRCASVASFASRHLVEEALTDNVDVVGVVATVTADVVVSVEDATGVAEEVGVGGVGVEISESKSKFTEETAMPIGANLLLSKTDLPGSVPIEINLS